MSKKLSINVITESRKRIQRRISGMTSEKTAQEMQGWPACFVRVNSATSEKLRELSENESLPRWKMLTRIILSSLPKYSYHMDDDGKLNRHNWPEH